jgi:FkbM family methyltransferase
MKKNISRQLQNVQLLGLSLLCKLPPQFFVQIFNLLNTLIMHYPVTITVNKKELEDKQYTLYTIKDNQDTLCITHPGRVRLYRNQIKSRLDKLTELYPISDIKFSADDLIVDCGANIGEVTKAIQNKYKVHAICIEPEAKEVVALRHNTLSEKTAIYQTLLWNKETTITFYQNNESADSTVFIKNENDKGVAYEARTLTSIIRNDHLFKKIGNIKLLKVEAEGAEPEILEGAEAVLPQVEYIAVDCGPERSTSKERNTVIPVLTFLLKHGFEPLRFNHDRTAFLFKNTNYGL